MPRITQISLLVLIGLWLLTGWAISSLDGPPAQILTAPQHDVAECLELASQVAPYPPSHARARR